MAQTHRVAGTAYGTCDRCGQHFERTARGRPYKFCGRQCAVVPVMARLLRNLEGTSEPGACLLWAGKKNQGGYGEIQHGKRVWKVHRLMWTLIVGPVPDDVEVCHSCDTPACVRVDHLFLGTHLQNMRDMAEKGRGVPSGVMGERHGAAKLTEAVVRTIFADPRSQALIAEQYGVAQSLVSQIKRKKVWKHLDLQAAA